MSTCSLLGAQAAASDMQHSRNAFGAPAGGLRGGNSRRSLATQAKKKTKKAREYGSGREALGLPPLPGGGGGAATASAPKLSDYLLFGDLMGEKPEEVQRQLALNNAEVEVDDAAVALLRDWESSEMEAYAVFESLMGEEGPAPTAAAASSTLERNRNRAVVDLSPQPKSTGPTRLTAAQRKLAKNRGQAEVPLTMPSLKNLGSMIRLRAQSSGGGGSVFEQVAAKPARPLQGLQSKPQRPGASPAQAPALEGEEVGFLDDDALWEEAEAELAATPPSYADLERALRPTPPARPLRRGAAAPAAAPPRPAQPRKPEALQPPPLRPASPAKPVPPAPKPVPALAPRPAMRAPPPAATAAAPAPAAPAAPVRPATKPPAEVVQPVPQQPLQQPQRPQPPAAAESQADAPVVTEAPARQPALLDVAEAAAALLAAPPAKPAPSIAPVEEQAPPAPEAAPPLQRPLLKSLAGSAVAANVAAALAAKRPAAPKSGAPSQQQSPAQEESAAQATSGAAAAAQQRGQMVEYARECLASQAVLLVQVWQVNGAGVLVRGDNISGFIPMTQLSTQHGMRVLEEEARLTQQLPPELAAAGGPPGEVRRTQLRRQAMAALLGERLTVSVIMVKEEGQVVLSERAAIPAREQSTQADVVEVAAAAAPLIGQSIPCTVRSVKPFGVFAEFEVPALPGSSAGGGEGGEGGEGGTLKGVGLVHSSQLAWDYVPNPEAMFEVGQQLPAVINRVDLEKGRVFLSFRLATTHPLQETLETLLSLSGPGSSATARAEAAAAADGVLSGRSGAWRQPPQDLRPVLGDMADAVRFCEALSAVPGVASAELGVRLQSRASSQLLEVYLAKDDAELSPISSSDDDDAAAAAVVDALPYRLVLRKGLCVQEVAVRAALPRDAVRQLAADTVANLVGASP